jgi:mRNA-degrading endonuclease YafQ of YafQ-DinJ toxin-antitoxin module
VKRELIRTSAFVRAAKRHLKSRPKLRDDVKSALELLQEDAFDPRLKTHKLTGNLKGVCACSAGRDLRILFEFTQREVSEHH